MKSWEKLHNTNFGVCGEIDRKIVDIKVAMHDLEKLSYSEDIDFLENLEKQLDNMNIEFYKLKQEIIKKVEKF